MPNAKLGAKVDRYSFFVRFLPPLLHTGLARRTNIAIALTTGWRANPFFRLLSKSTLAWFAVNMSATIAFSPRSSQITLNFRHARLFRRASGIIISYLWHSILDTG